MFNNIMIQMLLSENTQKNQIFFAYVSKHCASFGTKNRVAFFGGWGLSAGI